jgi:hypothetical protein
MSSSVTTLNQNFHLTNLNPPLSPQKQTNTWKQWPKTVTGSNNTVYNTIDDSHFVWLPLCASPDPRPIFLQSSVIVFMCLFVFAMSAHGNKTILQNLFLTLMCSSFGLCIKIISHLCSDLYFYSLRSLFSCVCLFLWRKRGVKVCQMKILV